MRLHGIHSFNAFPFVVRFPFEAALNAFGPKAGRKVIHPDNGDVTIACEGFNKKNHYDRETPVTRIIDYHNYYALLRPFELVQFVVDLA